MEIMNELLV